MNKQTDVKPPGAYRVLHTADWHLGKMLGDLSRADEHQGFLDDLLGKIRMLSVDALVIAGDVFDSANPPQNAVAQYYDFLSALFQQGGCAVVVVSGNHDSPAHLDAPRQVLKALRCFVVGSMPQSIGDMLIPLPDAESPRLLVAAVPFLRDRDLRVGQSGQSATDIQRALVDGIQRRYDEVAEKSKPWIEKGIPVLATGHLTVVGSKVSDSEREIHVGGLGAITADRFPKAFAYIALGHLHRPQAAGGNETVRYSGSPIPLSFSEAEDNKSIQVLDFVGDKLAQQFGLDLPLMRQLTQLTTTREQLESMLGDFKPSVRPLPAWVELVVENPVAGENLFNRAQEIAKDKSFQVVRVVSQAKASGANGADGEMTPMDLDGASDLLAEPAKVFERRLKEEAGLTAEESGNLKSLFNELLELHNGQQQAAVVAAGCKADLGGEA